MTKIPFQAANILLPDFSVTDGEKWAVIACDQYTSEPDYWQGVADAAGDAPSTLSLILPELYLNDSRAQRVTEINRRMREYLAVGIFREHNASMIYLERTCRNGSVRRGLVGAIDLEDYSYAPDA
ncbi:MAG: DUF1015 family protein, partial [Clostridia bacterium]|nr:DUF1015 family protein [Clostridia bacterium]